ncbi:3-phosphoshikimate 1-carboxyvinyltransferase [Halolactibacillus halophilus]|uniref:3-phosphoshikimate 1-carboxyvinyltransferase n=1 Tax=Halolactibacillus halophilus TaxID=306540 RepID=A0A1I5PB69_9BACI|nr:3-phosphoshikimate 1-carboxyvinyltransferase [Halolactibacillus halophilus]GEM02843.1 3-phosphoshikimate 1-carboxyvinyltransferase [Halolactibacillus halophilus]SFP30716.1 3-phosphoshikimate 1-carboxyvinyltransferase [Halolactibacillus halophilus]
MSDIVLQPTTTALIGDCFVPGDKSISHRAVFFGSLAKGKTDITNFLTGDDCLTTIKAFESMGVQITQDGEHVQIESRGYKHLNEPTVPIDLGNSGTTARLLLGVLSGLPFHTTVFGDESLTKRPMDRVAIPLREMGARIDGREEGKYLPLAVRGQTLSAITFKPQVKSAQVKSGVLLAGLLANGTTTVIESIKTRDHTENMLRAFGAKVVVNGLAIEVEGKQTLTGTTIQVPRDISSAAFFIVAALIVKGSKVTLKDVGLNPTRTGILAAIQLMGAHLDIKETTNIGGEIIGDVMVSYQPLKGAIIEGAIIPSMIDEIPILALLATQAEGQTIIKDAEELRFKETDRIDSVVATLRQFGCQIEPTADGMIIEGGQTLNGATADSHGDHRIGMMIAIASLIATGETTLTDKDAINVSYPSFFEHLETLKR